MPWHRIVLGLVALAGATALGGCRGGKEPPKAPPPARVTVIHPVVVPVRDYWSYNGYLDTTKSVEVRSKIRGFLAKVEFTEGTEVEAGKTLLYTLEDLDYNTAVERAKAEVDRTTAEVAKAGAMIKNSEAQLVLAEADLKIKKETTSVGGARLDLVTAQATRDVRAAEKSAAEASLKAAVGAQKAAESALKTANIQLGYTHIKAKIGGRISRTLVDEGALILADTTVLTSIVAVDELYIYFDAPEADFLAYRKTPGAARPSGPKGPQIPVHIGITDEIGYPHKGHIDFQENRVETATGTIHVRGRIKNPMLPNGLRALYPGLYARVRVPKGEPKNQPSIPEDCLLSGQEGRYVYVVGADNKVAKRVVHVGATVWKAPPSVPGESPPSWVVVNPKPGPAPEGQPPPPTRRPVKSIVAITAGLKAEDRIILDGIQRAQPGKPVAPEDWTLTPPAAKK